MHSQEPHRVRADPKRGVDNSFHRVLQCGAGWKQLGFADVQRTDKAIGHRAQGVLLRARQLVTGSAQRDVGVPRSAEQQPVDQGLDPATQRLKP